MSRRCFYDVEGPKGMLKLYNMSFLLLGIVLGGSSVSSAVLAGVAMYIDVHAWIAATQHGNMKTISVYDRGSRGVAKML